jgi:hypothetical protein
MWEIYEFVNKVYYHFVGWRNDQNKSFRPWRVVQLCCWWLFQLESFAILKSCLKLKIWVVQTKSDGVMTKIKVVDLDEFYKFMVYDFSFEVICYQKNLS